MQKREKKWGTLKKYKQVCKEIFEERGGVCEKCGVGIYEEKYHNFNHTAGRTDNYLNKDTIELLCFQCHSLYHGIKESATWLN